MYSVWFQLHLPTLLLFGTVLLSPVDGRPAEQAQSQPTGLAAAEYTMLRPYLSSLLAGAPSNPDMVDQLDGSSIHCLQHAMSGYANAGALSGRSHQAIQSLLTRMSKQADMPALVLAVYAPELLSWLSQPPAANPTGAKLFQQLRNSNQGQPAADLAVRLVPTFVISALAEPAQLSKQEAFYGELLKAWNRRLRKGIDDRPIQNLEARLHRFAQQRMATLEPQHLAEELIFLGSWKSLSERFQQQLQTALNATASEIVLSGLRAQRRHLYAVAQNITIVQKHRGNHSICESAIRNIGHDSTTDHAEQLARLWDTLIPDNRLRYFILYAMGVHPHGNHQRAVAALETYPDRFNDVALSVLHDAPQTLATKAVNIVLTSCQTGHEEALRMAAERSLPGFEEMAVTLAHSSPDQIVRQRAIGYLGTCSGEWRTKCLNLLQDDNEDIRYAAIQMFASADDLSQDQLKTIGVAMTATALRDSVPYCRQEALFALGLWQTAHTRPVFASILASHPDPIAADQPIPEAQYWPYRYRLLAQFGLANLGDKRALNTLLHWYAIGDPQVRLDVLSACKLLKVCPPHAVQDLAADELLLTSAATSVVQKHGNQQARARLAQIFHNRELWRLLAASQFDDKGLLDELGFVD